MKTRDDLQLDDVLFVNNRTSSTKTHGQRWHIFHPAVIALKDWSESNWSSLRCQRFILEGFTTKQVTVSWTPVFLQRALLHKKSIGSQRRKLGKVNRRPHCIGDHAAFCSPKLMVKVFAITAVDMEPGPSWTKQVSQISGRWKSFRRSLQHTLLSVSRTTISYLPIYPQNGVFQTIENLHPLILWDDKLVNA